MQPAQPAQPAQPVQLHGGGGVAFTRVKQCDADGIGATLARMVGMIVAQMPHAWRNWSTIARRGVDREGAKLLKQRCVSAPRAGERLSIGGADSGGAVNSSGSGASAPAAKRKTHRCASAPRARASTAVCPTATSAAQPSPASPARQSKLKAGKAARKSRPLSAPPVRNPLGSLQVASTGQQVQ